jgi:23S rRNA (guanosine2251-2'-O)-methyltransferase
MSGPNREILYGRNPVLEALRAGRRRVHRLILAEGVQVKGALQAAVTQARNAGIPIDSLPRADLDRFHANHQGLVAAVGPYAYADLQEIVWRTRTSAVPALVLLLDTLQDPQNLGTLLRTAEAVAVHGVVIPLSRSAGVTPAVVSASSGASEHLFVARANLAQAMQLLKEAGLWMIGLEGSALAVDMSEVDLSLPLGVVVGNEAEGLRRLVRQGCDHLIRLRMSGHITSLNAAVAGSIVLYRAWEARGFNSAPGTVA